VRQGCRCHRSHGQHSCCCAGHHRHHENYGRGGHPFRFQRRFSTRREEAEALERCLNDLEAEAEGVRERLKELKQA
jgi:hypothetical protein